MNKATTAAPITERIKTMDDVFAAHSITQASFTQSCEGLAPDEVGYRKYKLLAAALNEGWEPDWSNSNEYKYWPWMKYNAGSAFSFGVYVFDDANSDVGSRLCFKSRELAEYAGKQFADVINEFFLMKKLEITDRVKTFEDAVMVLGIQSNGEPLPYTDNCLPADCGAIEAFAKLSIIARALNEGWAPDWSDRGQYKYYPWFKANPSGSAFSFGGCVCDAAYASVGSRLVFKTEELAKYAGTQFLDIYNQFLSL